MGYMRHHAIVVTSWHKRALESAYAKARELFCRAPGEAAIAIVSDITRETMNGYRSFFVAPDGSKEGWPESNNGDAAREQLIAFLRQPIYPDGSTPIDFVEVQFGDGERETRVISHSDDDVASNQE